MYCIDRVFQRVRIRRADAVLPALKSLPTPVGAVMGVIGSALQAKTATQGVGLFVEEIAKRAFKGKRSVQMALKQAETLGLIRRVRQAGSIVGRQKPHLILVHSVLISQAGEKNAHKGPILLFPRDWNDLSLLLPEEEVSASPLERQSIGSAVSPPATAPRLPRARGARTTDLTRPAPHQIPSLDLDAIQRSLAAYFGWIAHACRGVGHEPTFQIAAQRRNRGGVRGGVFSPCGLAAEVSERDVVQAAASAVQWSAPKRAELTFQLCSKTHPVLLLDDITAAGLTSLPWPGAVVETSPGNFQVTLVADRPLSAQDRLLAQHGLQRHTNADKGAVSASQLRRMPGSVNGKFELSAAFVATLHSVPGVGQLCCAEGLVDRFIAAGRERSGAASEAGGYRNKPADSTPKTGVAKSQSEADFGWLIYQLTRKAPRPHGELLEELAAKAGARGRHGLSRGHPEHVAYAERTLVACLKKLGTI